MVPPSPLAVFTNIKTQITETVANLLGPEEAVPRVPEAWHNVTIFV